MQSPVVHAQPPSAGQREHFSVEHAQMFTQRRYDIGQARLPEGEPQPRRFGARVSARLHGVRTTVVFSDALVRAVKTGSIELRQRPCDLRFGLEAVKDDGLPPGMSHGDQILQVCLDMPFLI
jgi:hypothetical protein